MHYDNLFLDFKQILAISLEHRNKDVTNLRISFSTLEWKYITYLMYLNY